MMADSMHVEMIPIDAISVVNPRERSKKIHAEITESIARVGLKRPITVRRLPGDDGAKFALVCGQGRLESYVQLGQTTVAAIVVEADSTTGYVMSIVENVARRLPRASETLEQIAVLRGLGYTDGQIAKKIGVTTSWVNHVGHLLAKGEKRLLAAAEAGHIPMHLAVSISRATEPEAQNLLLEAHERGELKGKKVTVMRRLLERRIKSGKQRGADSFSKSTRRRHISNDELAKMYQQDIEKHKLIQIKASHAQTALLVSKQIFIDLLAQEAFRDLLNSEGLNSIPQPLMELAQAA